VHAVKIAAGGAASAAISSGNDVYLWGYNEAGNLGVGSERNVELPTRMKLLKGTDIALGEEHSVMICEQGTIWTMGKNNCGRLGVVDAMCDEAENLIENAIVLDEDDGGREDVGGEDSGDVEGSATSAITLTAYPLPIGVDSSNNDADNFNEVIREMVR